MLVERPDQKRLQELVAVYGSPRFEDMAREAEDAAEADPTGSCGMVILLIFNLASSCVFVRRKDDKDWSLPMGRIAAGEGIIEAAHRTAMEEVGIRIVPLGVPLCQVVTLSSGNTVIQRWHLAVVAETAASVLDPNSTIDEARFFDVAPPISDGRKRERMMELHRAGTRFMRSLDSLDGI